MRPLAVGLLLALALVWAPAAAPAQAGGPGPVTLLPLPPGEQTPGQESVVLSARVLLDGRPLAGAKVTFYILTDVFGQRLMKVGEATADVSGTAAIIYQPTWDGDHTVVVRFAGTSELAPTQTSYHFQAAGSVSPYEPAKFGLEPVRRWLPAAVGLVVLAVWASLGYALASTALGIRAAAAGAAPQPTFFPAPRTMRPAPLAQGLAALLALVVIAAVPAVLLLGKARAPEDLSFSTGDHYLHSAPVAEQAPPVEPGAQPALQPLPAALVRRLQMVNYDVNGQPAPGSVLAPSAVAVTSDRPRILDSARGRIVAVTPDWQTVPILEDPNAGGISLKGAPAMVALKDKLYVQSAQGPVILVSSAGDVDGVIRPLVPEGLSPLAPAGIAITNSREIWLSDQANHRVISLNTRGEFQRVIGTGAPSGDPAGLSSPSGLAIDNDGNLLVADSGNHLVKKFSPLGAPLGAIGEGRLAWPVALAVDSGGRIFVADEGAQAVSVFAPDGTYLGSIKQEQMETPHSLTIDGDLLYVADRLTGLWVFQPGLGTETP